MTTIAKGQFFELVEPRFSFGDPLHKFLFESFNQLDWTPPEKIAMVLGVAAATKSF